MNEEEKEKEIDDLLKVVELWDSEISEYESKITACKQKKSEAIGKLKPLVPASFERGGKWFLIKTIAKTGTNSLTKFDTKPGSWLKKKEAEHGEV